jgi:hypothetical protein
MKNFPKISKTGYAIFTQKITIYVPTQINNQQKPHYMYLHKKEKNHLNSNPNLDP